MSDQSHDKAKPSDEGTTVAEAARILGITEGAVRKRVERRKLAAEHTQDGRLLVYLGRDTTTTDTARDRPRQSHDERYTRSLEEQVAYLRSQLEQEREARTEERRRQDTVIAQLSQANAEQARTIRELEAPPEARESTQTVEEEQELDTERARREMAETTLREGMDEERQRREEAEQERDNLRRELYALRDLREPPQTVEEEPERPEPHPATGGAQEATQRPWWRRVFG